MSSSTTAASAAPHSADLPAPSARLDTPTAAADAATDAIVVQDMVRWLERAVIGLNLCPFAKGVHTKGQIHYAVSAATDGRELLQDLQRELEALAEASPEKRDTTLLIAPRCMEDFLDFNDFLELADEMLARRAFAIVRHFF